MSELEPVSEKVKLVSSKLGRAKVVHKTYDYLVINTGYCSRIVGHYATAGNEIMVDTSMKKLKGGRHRKSYNLDAAIVANSKKSCKNHRCQDGCIKYWGREYDRVYNRDADPDISILSVAARTPLFIRDALWGDGLYILEKNGRIETDFVLSALEEAGSDVADGIIVFGGGSYRDAFQQISILQNLEYCACFESPYDMAFIEKKTEGENGEILTKTILVMTFDTESG